MKPFDLEKAKNGAAVCMRDGTPVKILDFEFAGADGFEIVYKYENDYCLDSLVITDDSGKCKVVAEEKEKERFDLFMAPTVGYMCIYNLHGKTLAGGKLRATLEECFADKEVAMDSFNDEVFSCFAKVELLDD